MAQDGFRMRRASFARSLKGVDSTDMWDYVPDGGATAEACNQHFFEIAWEVANKGKCNLEMNLLLPFGLGPDAEACAYAKYFVSLGFDTSHLTLGMNCLWSLVLRLNLQGSPEVISLPIISSWWYLHCHQDQGCCDY